jgi:hypothetical protein
MIETSPEIYITGVSVGVLLVGKVAGTAGTIFFLIDTEAGDEVAKNFTYNMGVPYYRFGQPKDGGYCLFGLQDMQLYFYRDTAFTLSSSFEFTYFGNEVSDVTFS